MALSVSAIKATIKAKREAAFGPPDDSGLADASYQADAEWMFDVLTVQASTLLNNGIDSGGDTLVLLTGKVL